MASRIASMIPSVAMRAGGELGCRRLRASVSDGIDRSIDAHERVERARAEVGADLDVGLQQVANVDVRVVAQAVLLGVDDEVARHPAQLLARRLDWREGEAGIGALEVMRFACVTIVRVENLVMACRQVTVHRAVAVPARVCAASARCLALRTDSGRERASRG